MDSRNCNCIKYKRNDIIKEKDNLEIFRKLFMGEIDYIFYNIYTGHIAEEYFDAVGKYQSVLEIHRSRHLKRTIQLYKLAKADNDVVMVELITQKITKLVIFFVHLATMLMLVPVE